MLPSIEVIRKVELGKRCLGRCQQVDPTGRGALEVHEVHDTGV
jgi:hypothetical protein